VASGEDALRAVQGGGEVFADYVALGDLVGQEAQERVCRLPVGRRR
jgi:hypothetical protein